MDYNQKLQKIIDYVEHHLQRTEEAINHDDIAKMAGCSYPFFQKVFSYMRQMSFADYVRARKLTLAGYDIKSTSMKIVDISYKYGYDSPTSFTKAFLAFHGVTPSEARKSDAKLMVIPKMQCTTSETFVWQLQKKKAIRLIGKKIEISYENNAQLTSIPAFWNECQKNGVFAALCNFDTGEPKGMFGVFLSSHKKEQKAQYAIMVESDISLPEGYFEMILPTLTWATFDCIGSPPKSIQKGWQFLNEEWLLQYPFAHAPYPEVEWYSNGNVFSENYLSQIWIPIIEEEAHGTSSLL